MGGSVAIQKANALRAAARPKPKSMAQQLLEPDAATKRLLQLTIDPATGALKAGAGGGQILVTMAKNLASREGKAGAGAYLALASNGIPTLSLGPLAQKNAAAYLKSLAVRGEDLTKIPKVSVLDPAERDSIRAVLKQRGLDPGPDASDAEILTATHKHKLGNLDILKNLPSSAGKALVGLPMGAWAAGQATGALAFQGNTKPLQQLGTGVADYYGAIKEHPLGALQRDPVGTVMAVLPAKTIIGGGAGKLAKTGALGKTLKGAAKAKRQPLLLPKARLSNDPLEAPQAIPVLDQAPFRSNLIDQAAQRAASKITQSSARLSRGRVEKLSAQRANEARHGGYQRREELLRSVLGAKRKLSKEEKRAVTAIAQGVTPRQMAEFYRIKAKGSPDSKHLQAQASLWDKVALKAPNLNDRMSRYLDAAEPAVREREAALQRVTSIDEAKLQAREGITQAEVQKTLTDAGSPLAAETTGRAPIYFPHVGTKPNYGGFLFKRGMNPTRRLNPEVKKNELALFKAGKWQPDTRHLESRIASAPLAEESLNHLQGQFREFGRQVPVGTQYDPRHATLVRVHPKGAKVEKIDTSGEGLAQQLRDVKAGAGGDRDFLQRLESQIVVHSPDGKVPDEPGLILVPNEVMDLVRGTLRSMNRGGLLRGLQTATDAWRYMTLYLRGAYLTNNLTGNTLQSVIGGVGPVSVARALKYGDVVPKKLVGTGTMAEMSRIQKLGGNADTTFGRAINSIADSAVGRAVSAGAGRNPIMTGNIAYENLLRKAMYLRHAIPEAKSAANGSRFSRVTDGVLEHLKNNEVPEATQAVVDFLGDMRKKNQPNLRLSVPFYRWIEFITQLSLKTLPAKYPVRNELIQALGRSGNTELAKMGLVPPWLHGSIPIDTSVENKDGSPHQMADLLSTQGLNPFATIEQTLGRGPQGVAGVFNPLVTSGLNTAFGRDLETGFDLRDASGKTISISRAGEPAFWRTLANQELRNLPFVNLFDPVSYKSADTLPLMGERSYPKGLRQPDMPTKNAILAYFTGARVRPTDLTLYNLQAAYKLIGGPKDELAAMGFSEDERKQIRHRINVELGKAKKKGLKVTVPILKGTPLTVTPLHVEPLKVGNNAP